MKPISPTLFAEQLKPSCTPSIKIQAQAYGHPAASTAIRFNKFDWVDTGFGGVTFACCPSDGSLLTYVGSKIRHYADPTVDSYTEVAVPTAVMEGSPTLVMVSTQCMIANPVTAEVLLLGFGTKGDWGVVYGSIPKYYVCYSQSMDYGATWGAWTITGENLPIYLHGTVDGESYLKPVSLKAAYKSDGDIGAIIRVSWWGGYSNWKDYIAFFRRTSGTWVSFNFLNRAVPPSIIRSEGGRVNCGQRADTSGSGNPSVSDYDIAWDGDWFVPIMHQQAANNNSSDLMLAGHARSLTYLVWGDSSDLVQDKLCFTVNNMAKEIDIADANIKINDLSDFNELSIPSIKYDFQELVTRFSTPDVNVRGSNSAHTPGSNLMRDVANRGGTSTPPSSHYAPGWGIFRNLHASIATAIRESQMNSTVSVIKLSNDDLVMTVHVNNQAIFYINRPDYDVINPVFYKGYAFESNYPFEMCANSTYIFAYNGYEIKRSAYMPWAKPTAGTGAGATYDIPFNIVVGVSETRNDDNVSTLEFIVDNSNDAYDSPGAGAITALKRGSRINVYLGYTVGSTNYYAEYARYFVDSVGYLRIPNRSLFVVKCVDGCGLLRKYRFCAPIFWNEYDNIYKYNYITNGNFSTKLHEDPVVLDYGTMMYYRAAILMWNYRALQYSIGWY